MKEIITYEELEEITSKAWLTVKEIMKITCVSEKEAYRLKRLIKENLENKGYYIPNGLLPTIEVLDFLKI